MASNFRSQASTDTDDERSSSNTTKKQEWTPPASEAIVNVLTGMHQPRAQSRVADKKPLSATHAIRQLRAQVAAMEAELHQLQSKWTRQLPDTRTLTIAQYSARKKYEKCQTEVARNELQNILLEQQFMFATLQTAVLHAPLHSSGREMLKALHFDTHLGHEPVEREKVLLAHNRRSLTTMPSIVDKFVQATIDRTLARSGKDQLVMPLSQIDVTGCADGSIISGVFVSDIPSTSLEEVYEAVMMGHFYIIPTWMKRHFGADVTLDRLNDARSPVIYWRLSLRGIGVPTTVNHVFCSELTPSYGVFHVDAITDDSLHPVYPTDLLQFGLCGMTLTSRKDVVTGKTLSITLQWLVVYRYNLLPNDPILNEELELIRPILNGDLITSSVCTYLHEKQRSSMSVCAENR